jgi:transcriptional regulator with XRE-family HTH domain
MKTFKEKRLAKSMSQSQLAVAVGVSLVTIQTWERGTSSPSPENQEKLDKVFGGRA